MLCQGTAYTKQASTKPPKWSRAASHIAQFQIHILQGLLHAPHLSCLLFRQPDAIARQVTQLALRAGGNKTGGCRRPCCNRSAIHSASRTSVSGNRIVLPPSRPLRTARETFASSSSSL